MSRRREEEAPTKRWGEIAIKINLGTYESLGLKMGAEWVCSRQAAKSEMRKLEADLDESVLAFLDEKQYRALKDAGQVTRSYTEGQK